jgi:UDP-N-acetylglucosamine acyltransferase
LASIHATAQVEGVVADDVTIGAYCVVGPGVCLSRGVRLHEHVIVKGETVIGDNTEIFPFASIGQQGQIAAHCGPPGKLNIGTSCVILPPRSAIIVFL